MQKHKLYTGPVVYAVHEVFVRRLLYNRCDHTILLRDIHGVTRFTGIYLKLLSACIDRLP